MFNDGVTVDDMQDDVIVTRNSISGTLHKLTEGSLVTTYGAGHFIALKFEDIDPDATSVKVGLEPSAGTGLVEIINDPDKNGGFKITNKLTQKFKVVQTCPGYTKTQLFDLSGLTLEN